ncbi:hypothetical protein BBF96_03715 [Anoxybacter fermentans]|uniref:Type II secretion system protein K n=1 Tax=Anoxybacter fermentans TaxID=1323375 RepID=A0A3S9SWA1_9FIRM|nr:type II secretion system protein GspK [Anoxybacter fermentans]AZR72569.1 hypothetical protein BBF96_03715 [Anoxybacter fermentans]
MKPLRSEDGIALIMVLWTIVILSFLMISLSEDIQLESFLTRNLMEQNQVQFIAQAGIARGLAELKGDKTLADGKQEHWLIPIKGQIEDRGTFEVVIEDIGSRFNINYIGEPVLSHIVVDFSKEFAGWRKEKFPFYLLQELEEFGKQDFQTIEDQITFYGKFNLNTDDYEILKEIMVRKKISEWTANQVIQELSKIDQPLLSIDDLLLKVPSLDLSTLEEIRDEIDVKGNININLVDEEILVILMDSLDIPQDRVTTITTIRDKETIKNLNILKRPIGEEYFKKLFPYFDVTSKYFRITSFAKSASSSIQKTIVVEVERIPEKVAQGRVLEWRTKILSWVES